MRPVINFDPAKEYEALRTELQEARSYVFERPLLILGAVAGVAAFGADKMKMKAEYMALLPPLITALMIYNLWSTAWRQSNSSRIVAYIQTAFEERDGKAGWWGWETCLRVYRDNAKKVETCVKDKMEEDCAKPDPLMYWKALWFLHIGIVFVALVVSVALPFFHGCVWPDLLGLVVNPLLATGFGYVCCRNCPKKMGFQFECERKVWKEVLVYLDARQQEL